MQNYQFSLKKIVNCKQKKSDENFFSFVDEKKENNYPKFEKKK